MSSNMLRLGRLVVLAALVFMLGAAALCTAGEDAVSPVDRETGLRGERGD